MQARTVAEEVSVPPPGSTEVLGARGRRHGAQQVHAAPVRQHQQQLAYAEAKGRVRRGHRVWQIGFGSGFKCNSTVWRALRDVAPVPADGTGGGSCNPWVDSIQNYPPKAYI
ncbi:hypothetical protein SETIT_9G285500v2 [Setaria italica]|uniref:Beta-ketoacyl-[acyl-carrier-protein] synthase III C-terminal domain-containing protein n=1 Tax=Setaria italica TaxID=4555 RepID=A0A368SLR3_SETIT|nr:hypothetical protein SETIT_9G285500v2 [Setaria italica]